jgi:hypothetical protein
MMSIALIDYFYLPRHTGEVPPQGAEGESDRWLSPPCSKEKQ